MSTFKAKHLSINAQSAGKNHQLFLDILRKWRESEHTDLQIEFVCPEVLELRTALRQAREIINWAANKTALDRYEIKRHERCKQWLRDFGELVPQNREKTGE